MDLSGPEPFVESLTIWSNLAIAVVVNPPPEAVSSALALGWALLSG